MKVGFSAAQIRRLLADVEIIDRIGADRPSAVGRGPLVDDRLQRLPPFVLAMQLAVLLQADIKAGRCGASVRRLDAQGRANYPALAASAELLPDSFAGTTANLA